MRLLGLGGVTAGQAPKDDQRRAATQRRRSWRMDIPPHYHRRLAGDDEGEVLEDTRNSLRTQPAEVQALL